MKKRFTPLDTTPHLVRALEGGDPVVLPSGRRAVVVRRLPDARLECRYLGGAERDTVEIAEELVRLIRPGVVPPPVRFPKKRVA